MKKMSIALQVYSVRENAEKDFEKTMKVVKEMGYDGVELAGLYGLSAKDVKLLLQKIGLKAISAHIPLEELTRDTQVVIDCYKEIGCSYLVVPYLPEDCRPGHLLFEQVLTDIERIGQLCAVNGIELLYHNHDFEFIKMDTGEYALDYIYRKISPMYLKTEIDTCWIKVSGEDPAEYIRKYTGRCPLIHLKDYYMNTGKKPKKLYELIGIKENQIDDSSEIFEFRPLGYGLQNIEDLVKASAEACADWLVVEQDTSKERPSLEAARLSIDYLKAIS